MITVNSFSALEHLDLYTLATAAAVLELTRQFFISINGQLTV